ncbi:hypothetical protein PVT67_10055 [Gallaecimonas kandeliae]|uniref:hypothetical protein n=1 Tax=Gallaecimonas kandeliae TaxID=3029055 RepID=UPI0026476FC5|nr:hypothetical protein [Gallaecimonas kandeliae]WKE64043.1 hypothetical protein PVT67_10055 [Gallaecimonas kandeliae]
MPSFRSAPVLRHSILRDNTLRIAVIVLTLLTVTSCSTSAGRAHAAMAKNEQEKAYTIGQEEGNIENTQAVQAANDRAEMHREQEGEADGFPQLDFLFKLLVQLIK